MQRDIYFNENSHPHSYILIIGKTATIADYFDLLIKKKLPNLKVNKGNVLKNCFLATENLCQGLSVNSLLSFFQKPLQTKVKRFINI